MKADRLLLRPTCDELREQLVVAVDDVDRHVSGRLQEKWTALQRDAQFVITFAAVPIFQRSDSL